MFRDEVSGTVPNRAGPSISARPLAAIRDGA